MSRTTAAAWDIEGYAWPCTESATELLNERARIAAQQVLYALSGRRVGLFSTTGEQVHIPGGCGCITPYKTLDGQWHNGRLTDGCTIELSRQPVQSIQRVEVQGQVINDYELVGNSLLRPDTPFPADLTCDVPGVVVDYTWGLPPDEFATFAMLALACEFLAGFRGDNCRLPSQATSITRQGVSVEIADGLTWFKEGLTGIPPVDQYIMTVNPNRLKRRSRVYSPDLPRSVG